jgi:hypothetical protein
MGRFCGGAARRVAAHTRTGLGSGSGPLADADRGALQARAVEEARAGAAERSAEGGEELEERPWPAKTHTSFLITRSPLPLIPSPRLRVPVVGPLFFIDPRPVLLFLQRKH